MLRMIMTMTTTATSTTIDTNITNITSKERNLPSVRARNVWLNFELKS